MMNPLQQHQRMYLPVTAETELSSSSAHSGNDSNENHNDVVQPQPPVQARVLSNYSHTPQNFIRVDDRNRAVANSLMISSMGMLVLIMLAAAISKPVDYISTYIYSSNGMYFDAQGTTTVSLNSLIRLQAITKLSESEQISSVYLFVPYDLISANAYDDTSSSHQKLMYTEQVISGLGSIDYYYDSGLVTKQSIVKFFRKDPTTILLTESNQKYRAEASLRRDFPEKIITSFPVVEDTENGVLVTCDVLGNQSSLAMINDGYSKDSKYTSILPSSSSKLSMISLNISSGYYKKKDTNSLPFLVTNRVSIVYIAPEVNIDSKVVKTGCNSVSYIPRIFHPRSGLNEIVYYNESALLFEPRDQHMIQRHYIMRNASDQVMPIVFFVDTTMPEPFFSAALEGIEWWDVAFRYAGWPAGTFKALPAPVDMDPFSVEDMVSVKDREDKQNKDCLYSSMNYVHWIHRDYRGYSVGQRITDPLNGRIFKGHVRLESLRMRQDVLIASSVLIPPEATDDERINLMEEITQLVVQRVKVLAAHEVGHALGLAHNFAGSSSSLSSAGSSVMDYPPPLFAIDGDRLVLNSNPYMSGIGDFDKVAIDYGYREFDVDTDFESYVQRNNIIDDAKLTGLSRVEKEFLLASERITMGENNFDYVYLNDQDTEKSDWRDSKWDQGTAENSNHSPIDSLENYRKLRRMALEQLHTNSLGPVGILSTVPQSSLMTESLPIVLLLHRYEVKSVSKLIGGYSISYNLMNGDALSSSSFSSYHYQYKALKAILSFLSPEELQIPRGLTKLFEPLAFGYESNVLGGIRDNIQSRLLTNEYDGIACIEAQVELIFEFEIVRSA